MILNLSPSFLSSDCPTMLLNAIVNDVLSDVQDSSKDEAPLPSGFDAVQNREYNLILSYRLAITYFFFCSLLDYQPLKLMQAVISKVNSVCSRLLDNAELMKLMPENAFSSQQVVGGYAPKYAALGLKNSRRKMEDRHVVIQDFNELYPGRVNISVIFFDF